jgi:hypothetical protein
MRLLCNRTITHHTFFITKVGTDAGEEIKRIAGENFGSYQEAVQLIEDAARDAKLAKEVMLELLSDIL